MTAYQDILTRLRAATGPDRELDTLISFVHYGKKPGTSSLGGGVIITRGGGYIAPEYSRSLDASISLLRRLLPDSGFFVGWGHERPNEPLCGAVIFQSMSADSEQLGGGEAPTLPLALLIALFEALQAREGAK